MIIPLMVAFVVVYFFIYIIYNFYSVPEYFDFCGDSFIIDSDSSCVYQYMQAISSFEKTLFFIYLGIGMILLLSGFYLRNFFSNGLAIGGGVLMIYGVVLYLMNLFDSPFGLGFFLKLSWEGFGYVFCSVLFWIILVVLVLLGYKKLKD